MHISVHVFLSDFEQSVSRFWHQLPPLLNRVSLFSNHPVVNVEDPGERQTQGHPLECTLVSARACVGGCVVVSPSWLWIKNALKMLASPQTS